MRTNAIIRIVAWSIAVVVLCSILAAGIRWELPVFQSRFGNDRSSSQTDTANMNTVPTSEAITIPADQVREISIEWVLGTIRVEPADVEVITISESFYSDDAKAMRWSCREGELDIVFFENSFRRGLGITIDADSKKDLTILVPKDWACEELELDAASANLEVRDLTVFSVDIDTASGTCTFDNCTVNSLDVDTASGDITFHGALQELDCDAASASFTGIFTNVPRYINLDTASGDLDLTLPENAGFTVTMDAMSSDFTSDFETVTRNGSHIHGDGSCRIDVDAMSGDVTIRKAPPA